MRALLPLILLVSVVFAGPVPGISEGNDKSDTSARISRSDLTYRFYSRQNSETPIDLKSTEVHQLPNTPFDAKKESVFIVHGWANTTLVSMNIIKEAILASHDVNVFVVDWTPYSTKDYLSARRSALMGGGFIAEFIRSTTYQYTGLSLAKFTLIGHCLGAHVCGNAGMQLSGSVGYIIGLNPAGPQYSSLNINNRLDATDGRYVQVIHTDTLLGVDFKSGHADYYPNGGESQPGCRTDAAGLCAHNRAIELYAESIRNNIFVSSQCSSYSAFTSGRCSSNPTSLMGGIPDSSSEVKGNFYLTTNSESPFGRN